MFNIGYNENVIVSHDELCKKIGVGCMGGVRFSKENNVLALFMKTNSQYDNSWDGEILKYMGSGKGDQSVKRMGNARLANSTENDTAVYLFEWADAVNLRFIGRMVLAGEPYYENRKNKYGENEKKVFFPLKIAQN